MKFLCAVSIQWPGAVYLNKVSVQIDRFYCFLSYLLITYLGAPLKCPSTFVSPYLCNSDLEHGNWTRQNNVRAYDFPKYIFNMSLMYIYTLLK